jgi:hypothetical protein
VYPIDGAHLTCIVLTSQTAKSFSVSISVAVPVNGKKSFIFEFFVERANKQAVLIKHKGKKITFDMH